MIVLTDVRHHAAEFLSRCATCAHRESPDNRGNARCGYRSPPVDSTDLLLAVLGAPQDRPSSRNYAARIALAIVPREDSSWAETWAGLGTPCPQYAAD